MSEVNPGNPKLDNNKNLTRLNKLRNNIKKTNVSQAIPFFNMQIDGKISWKGLLVRQMYRSWILLFFLKSFDVHTDLQVDFDIQLVYVRVFADEGKSEVLDLDESKL